LISGSNCCDPSGIHLFRRRADGSFAERTELRFTEPKVGPFTRGRARPHLVDWRRDGHADLVIGYLGHPPLQTTRPFQASRWTLLVDSGPLAEKKDLAVKLLELPPILGGSPIGFSFADWDGDGRVDLLVGVQWDGPPRYKPDGVYPYQPERFSVYWFRNTSDTRYPKFVEASHLFDVPYPWQLHALTAVNWGRDTRPSLVVSVSKSKAGEVYSRLEASELWLYRSKAELRTAPDRGDK
jgi:hypothetical protein